MPVLKYRDPADGLFKDLVAAGGGSNEVTIAGTTPADPMNELWVDTTQSTPVYDWSIADNRYLTSGFRNVIRNGDFSVAQRGNGPFTTANAYTLDGWVLGVSGGSLNLNRVLAVAGEESPRISAVVSGQSAAGDYAQILNVIENVSLLSGKVATVSFDAWATSGTPKVSLELQQIFGSGGTPSATQFIPIGAVTLSTTRTRYSVTFTVPSVAGASLGTNNNHFSRLGFWLSAGSTYAIRSSNIGIQNNTFYITDVQLEEGPAPTPFERLPIQQQLAWCQRYFQRWVSPPLRGVVTGTNTVGRMGMTLPVEMRVSPTVNLLSGGLGIFDGSNVGLASSIAVSYQTDPGAIELNLTLTTGAISTIGRAAAAYYSGGPNDGIDISAEL